MKSIHFKSILLLLSLFVLRNAFCQADSAQYIQAGKKIFQTNCSPCHGVHREILGPMLGSITKKKSKGWLKIFIADSQKVIASGDAYANNLAEQYNHAVMPDFNQLSPAELDNLLTYLEHESIHPTEQLVANVNNYEIYIQPDVLRGRQLFNEQCASCHSITKEAYGPALGSVGKRHSEAWLISFIRNSQDVIKRDPYAADLFKQFDNKVMVPMEFLSDQEIREILKYIEFVSSSPSFMGGSNGLAKPVFLHTGVERTVTAEDTTQAKTFFKILFIVVGSGFLTLLTCLVVRFYGFLTVDARK